MTNAINAGNSIQRRDDLGQVMVEKFEAASTAGFIADKIMPPISVPNNAGIFPIVPHDVLTKDEEYTLHNDGREKYQRNPREGFDNVSFGYKRGAYQTSEYGVEVLLDQVEGYLNSQDLAPTTSQEEIGLERIMTVMTRAREQRVINAVLNTAAFKADEVDLADNPWSVDNMGGANPVADIKEAVGAFRMKSGKAPAALIMSYDMAARLSLMHKVVDMLKYSAADALSLPHLDSRKLSVLLGVPVIVAGAVYDENLGLETSASFQPLWPTNKIALLNISTGAAWNDIQGIGRQPVWTGAFNGGVLVEQYSRPEVAGTTLRCREYRGITLFRAYNDTMEVTADYARKNIQLIDVDPAE